MKIADERSDAVELVKDIKQEMARMRDLLGELEYLIYKTDSRCHLEFFNGKVRKHDANNRKS